MNPKGTAAECETGIQIHLNPAGLVSPVLEQGFARGQQLLAETGIELLEARRENDGMCPRAGHGYGIELQIPESPDDAVAPVTGPPALACRPRRKTGEPRLQQAGSGKRKPTCLAYIQAFHRDRWS